MAERRTAEVDPNQALLSRRELERRTFELFFGFEHHLQYSENFMGALGGLYFGKTESGEPTDPNDRTVIFWESDDEGNETIKWAISYRPTSLLENSESLMVMKAQYDTDGQVEIEVNRLDLIKKMSPLLISPSSSIRYTGYNNTEIPKEIKPNSVLAAAKAQELLDQVKKLPNFS